MFWLYARPELRKGIIVLVLTRREGEKLIIGGNVTVTVLSIKGNQVRFGIDAPSDVTIHREEVYKRIMQQEKPLNGSARVGTPVPGVKAPVGRLPLSDKG
jgi:carbon storage regulator